VKRTKKNFKKRFIYVQKKVSDEQKYKIGESRQNALSYLDAGTHSTDEVHTATVTAIATRYRPHTEHTLQTTHRAHATDHRLQTTHRAHATDHRLQTTHRAHATDHTQSTCYRPHKEHTFY